MQKWCCVTSWKSTSCTFAIKCLKKKCKECFKRFLKWKYVDIKDIWSLKMSCSYNYFLPFCQLLHGIRVQVLHDLRLWRCKHLHGAHPPLISHRCEEDHQRGWDRWWRQTALQQTTACIACRRKSVSQSILKSCFDLVVVIFVFVWSF